MRVRDAVLCGLTLEVTGPPRSAARRYERAVRLTVRLASSAATLGERRQTLDARLSHVVTSHTLPRSIAALHGDEVDRGGLVALVADVVRSESR
jgi:hypothetical protein